MTTWKKRNRLFVDQVDTVGLVDKGDDPEARIVFLKAREEDVEKKRNLALEAALAELRDLTDQWMFDRQGVVGGVVRDIGVARVLSGNKELHQLIESLASRDAIHKAQTVRPGVERRAGVDSVVATLSKGLAPGDPRLGMQLLSKHFPKLHSRWMGLES